MQVSIDDLSNAFLKWAENDLAKKGNVFNQAIVFFLILQGGSKVKDMIAPLNILADSDGKFDKDTLHTNLKTTLEKIGGKLHINQLNYDFDSEDLDRVFDYLE